MAEYNLAQASTLSPEDYAQQQQLNRQQQMAAMLMQQGMQQPQGQMVSGRYVPTSFFQNLVPLANIAASQYIGNKADTKAAELAQALREKQQEATQNYIKASQGEPAKMYEQQAGPMPSGANIPQQIQTPATGPNYGKMFEAGTSQYASPQLKSAAYKLLEPITTKEGETITQRNLGAGGGMTPISVGGVALPSELKSAAIRLGLNPAESANWGPKELSAIDAKVMQDKRATASNLTAYMGKDLSSKVGDIMEASQAATTAAYQTKDSADRILTTLAKNNAIQGPAADIRVSGLQLANMIGASGQTDKEKLDNSRTLIQESAMLAANSAKLNKTPGAVSDYEQKLYTRIAGGDINLTPTEMALIAKRAKEGSEYQIQRHNAKMSYINSDKELKKLAPFYDVQAPAPSGNVVDYNSLPK
jgi:hypothetical protein